MNARKLADRETFNDWVWRKVIVQSQKFSEIEVHTKSELMELRSPSSSPEKLFPKQIKSIKLLRGCIESEEDKSAAAEKAQVQDDRN